MTPDAFDPHEIPGFIIDHIRAAAGPVWTATRKTQMSWYQRQHGCKDIVMADSKRELGWVCMAERIKADLVAAAERELDIMRRAGQTGVAE